MPSSQHAVVGQRLSETHPRLARLSSSHQPRILSPTSMQGEQTDIYDTIYSVRWSLRNATYFNPDYGVGSIYRSTLCVSLSGDGRDGIGGGGGGEESSDLGGSLSSTGSVQVLNFD